MTAIFKNLPKKTPKSAKSRINSVLQQNNVKFGTHFTPARKIITPALLACWNVFLISEQNIIRPSKGVQHHQQRWCKIVWTGVNLLLLTYGVLLQIDFLVQILRICLVKWWSLLIFTFHI